jgi:virginiamycin B lyase
MQSRVANAIGAISTGGSITDYPLGAFYNPGAIAPGVDGNMWLLLESPHDDLIGKITTAGAFSTVPLSNGVKYQESPPKMVRGGDGNLWFRNRASIVRVTMTGTTTVFDTSQTGGNLQGDIAVGADGNVWYGDGNGATEYVASITTSGTTGMVTKYALPSGASGGYVRLGRGPDGNIWFVNDPFKVGKITPTGTITQFSLTSTDLSYPGPIGPGPDGNVWFGASQSKLAAMAPGNGTIVKEVQVACAIDSLEVENANLWFTELGCDLIGKYKP